MAWPSVLSFGQPSSYGRRRRYKFGRVVGAGTYGVVKEAVERTTKIRFAVKIISKKLLPTDSVLLQHELLCLQTINLMETPHSHLVRLHDYFESRTKHYLVFDLALGGELFDHILEQGKFTERDAARLTRCLVDAVRALHTIGIVHRDLKPENLLFKNRENLFGIVVVDFGISRIINHDETFKTVCGSPGYCAPEILMEQNHGKACDMWSVGVITFTILCGYSPFGSIDDPQTTIQNMMLGEVKFDEWYWKHVSDEAKSFIISLLRLDPSARLTADQALQHPWLANVSYPLDQYGEPHICQSSTVVSSEEQHNDYNLLSENVLTNMHTIRGLRNNRMPSNILHWLRQWQDEQQNQYQTNDTVNYNSKEKSNNNTISVTHSNDSHDFESDNHTSSLLSSHFQITSIPTKSSASVYCPANFLPCAPTTPPPSQIAISSISPAFDLTQKISLLGQNSNTSSVLSAFSGPSFQLAHLQNKLPVEKNIKVDDQLQRSVSSHQYAPPRLIHSRSNSTSALNIHLAIKQWTTCQPASLPCSTESSALYQTNHDTTTITTTTTTHVEQSSFIPFSCQSHDKKDNNIQSYPVLPVEQIQRYPLSRGGSRFNLQTRQQIKRKSLDRQIFGDEYVDLYRTKCATVALIIKQRAPSNDSAVVVVAATSNSKSISYSEATMQKHSTDFT